MGKQLNKLATDDSQNNEYTILFNEYRYSVNDSKVTFDLINYPYYNSYFNNIDPLIDNALN